MQDQCSKVSYTSNKPRCPSVDEAVRKLWYINMMEYYLAMKRNASESSLMRWVNLQPIQSEGSKKEKEKYRILMCIHRI